ncbi:MAG: hypothetical protein V1816_03285 [Pseudomonadota bacterium]
MVVIVLGMHRSGSSLAAGILHNLGIDMGPKDDASFDNPRGFFEDRAFTMTNDFILREAGGAWDSPPSLDSILAAGRDPRIKRQIEAVLEARRRKGQWGFKDPRTILTLPLYFDRLEDPAFVCTHRNLLALSASLEKRNDIPLERALGLALIYEKRRLALLSKYDQAPKVHISYEALLADRREVDRLALFVNRPATPEALALVDPVLRHHA